MRLIALALLTLVSMGATAQTKINVQIANDGNFDGGTIEVTGQEELKEDGVKVTITVSPNSGYTIKKEAIEVYATYPPSGSRADTRDIEIASNLPLLYNGSEKEDVKDASAKRDYTFTVPSGFGAWIKEAKFQNNRDGAKGTMDFNLPDGYYYLGNEAGDNGISKYVDSNFEANFYMCPANSSTVDENNYLGGDVAKPLITTFKSFSDNKKNNGKTYLWAVWYIEAATGDNAGCFYIRHKETGKYLVANDNTLPTATRRRVNLGPIEKPEGTDGLFKIQSDDTGKTYYIYPKEKKSDGNKYLTPSNGNKDQLDANNANSNTGGILGFYTSNKTNSAWHFVPAPCDPPVITNNFDGTFTLTAETGATIYYTTNGDTPTLETMTKGSTPVNVNQPGTMTLTLIKAIAKVASNESPSIVTTYELPQCAKPIIKVSGGYVTISCATAGATIHYTKDDTPATSSSTNYETPFAKGDAITIRAIATSPGYVISSEAILLPPTEVSSSDGITDMTGNYILSSNFNSTASIGTSDIPFKGTIDGNMVKLSGLDHPLVAYADGAIIKNVILDNVNISSGTNVGAICGEAKGDTRIYNCGVLSGSVGGSNYVGGIVGKLDDASRVINCYSYATITGGTDVGGIVGYNNATTKAGSINTMVMNCMFYGDITGGSTISPIYGGNNIANLKHNSDRAQDGLNTFNYYAYEKLKTEAISDNKYNSALAVEEKYLTRFEYYRLLLNSNKKLAAFYATGSPDNADQMAKWVLETADRTINDPKPYPVLKAQGYYPSIINPDFENAPSAESAGRNKGGKLGTTLTVTIDGVGTNAPSGASITKGSLTLQRTDKDFDRFNFNYDKVQLPYYNEVGTGNYTGNRVVTGWKITSINGGTEGTYKAADEWGGYNFADRNCTNKDKFDVSGRVFSQGAYFDVPYGVTSITIEPYWGNAIYVADQYYDVVYKNDYTGKQDVSQTGTQVTTFNGQSVKNSITDLGSGTTVYDNAVVLVGNFHLDNVPSGGSTPFTMMSVDEDNDHEPDYSLIYHHKDRTVIAPIRFDFLNIPGTAQAQKPNGASLICNFTIFKTKGWFEVTNTSSFYTSQLEYENQESVPKSDAPLILLGGVIDQFVSTQRTEVTGKTIYIHVGGNAWINSFGLGTHSDGNYSTPHVPVSVTGGEYEGFYLTGTYNQDAAVRTDNAECYISGGHFVEAAGASQEAINGNVRWQIYNADIDNFFGGGTNDAKPIAGDVTVDIYNSNVTLYCGGPKFGNMQTGKKVTTNAEGCTFGKYFGAGYGGTAYSRKKYYDESTTNWNSWDNNYIDDRGKYFDGKTTNAVQQKYGKKGIGVATDFDYEFFVWSTGQTGGRFFVKFASFSLAQCNDVESNLKGCTVNENFYGGGSLGSVVGTATSVLEDCTVQGNVFGGGYSATLPTVQVRDGGFTQFPNFNASSGLFEPAVLSVTTEFEWKNASEAGVTLTNAQSGSNLLNHYLYTNTDLSALGQVAKTNLTIKGNTVVRGIVDGNVVGGVFGGGDESKTTETTTVDIQAGSVSRVFGGGNKAAIGGNTTVQINGGSIVKDVYGGGKEGDVGGNAALTVKGGVIGTAAEKGSVHGGGYGEQTHVSGNVEVNIGTRTGAGTQQDPHQYAGSAEIYGDVYGGSAFGTVNSGLTNTTNVNLFHGVIHGDAYGGGLGQIGREAQDAVGTEGQEGYQPAVTEIKAIAAQVKGVVNVTLDGAQFDTTNGEDDLIPANTIPVSGRIFGCNNLNGSPEGNVFINISRTVGYGAHQRTAEGDLNKEDATHTYELAAVYGGGNLAAYLPNGPAATAENNDYKNTEYKATINIDGCDNVSIQQVYGGGNAASTPAALVNVYGTWEIEELFGGGNGMDRIQKNGKWYANPGANMGFLEYADNAENAQTPEDRASNYGYGSGETNVKIYGGRIHRVFGGANTKGNVRIIALTILEDENQCTFMVDEAYGGGKSASMDGAAELKMACIPGLKAAYGGAQEADINNDVTLNITNGTFERIWRQ